MSFERYEVEGRTTRGAAVTVKCEIFKSTMQSWQSLAEDAAEFATKVGQQNLINISVSAEGAGSEGCIFVWYWE